MVWDALRTDEFTVFKDSFLSGPTVCESEDTSAVMFTIPEFPDILVAVGPDAGASAVMFAIPEFPDILVAVGPDAGALAVCPTRSSNVEITRRQSALPIGRYC